MISLNILPLDSEQFERATYGSIVSIKKVSPNHNPNHSQLGYFTKCNFMVRILG